MRLPRPKSLSGLMLLGLALIAGPLLVAVIDAAIQIRALAKASEELVREGVQTAQLSQSLSADIYSLKRTAQFYQVLNKPDMLDTYRVTDQRLANTRTQLAHLLDDAPSREGLDEFAATHDEISRAVTGTPAGSPAFSTILTSFDRLSDLANAIADSGKRQT